MPGSMCSPARVTTRTPSPSSAARRCRRRRTATTSPTPPRTGRRARWTATCARCGRPVTTDHINLVQPLYGDRNRWITKATLRFGDGHEVNTQLGDESRTPDGQTVTFPRRRVKSFEIAINETNLGKRSEYAGVSGVGFSEIRVRDQRPGAPDVHVEEITRMPVDLTNAVGGASLSHRLVYSMSRSRTIL